MPRSRLAWLLILLAVALLILYLLPASVHPLFVRGFAAAASYYLLKQGLSYAKQRVDPDQFSGGKLKKWLKAHFRGTGRKVSAADYAPEFGDIRRVLDISLESRPFLIKALKGRHVPPQVIRKLETKSAKKVSWQEIEELLTLWEDNV